jgi:hypothetical protein
MVGHLGLLSPPAVGQTGPEATVTATLRIASACLIVSPTAVDFGTMQFTQPAVAPRSVDSLPAATATVSVRNCSSQAETVLVRGGPVTGGGITWSHAPPGADPCAGPNLFVQGVRDAARSERRLSLADQVLKTLPAGATEPVTLTLVPPCSGSVGAGTALTVTYTFIATLTEPGAR